MILDTIIDKDNTIITTRIRDPHHGSDNEWGYHDGQFYHHHANTKTWTRVKKISLTPERIKALYRLIT